MKKGFTLIELVVSMGIFTVVAALAIGAFVTVSRMKDLTSSMRETQQKVRVGVETIGRLARQADTVIVTPSPTGNTIEMYFNTKTPDAKGVKFTVVGTHLYFYDNCTMDVTGTTCTSWPDAPDDMFSGLVYISNTDNFSKVVTNGSPELNINLQGKINNVKNSPYYSDSLNINTNIVLESLK